MDKENEIYIALNHLALEKEYQPDEFNFSDKVNTSFKIISNALYHSKSNKLSKNINKKDWDIVIGSFKKISKDIKEKYPGHLVIIQNGCFYEVIDEDVDFFHNRFSFNTFQRFSDLVTGFPIFSKTVLSELKDMKKSFVLVSQLSERKNGKVQRAISEVFSV
tara:strand:- start:889 stop:1374 length:486 start_codon:yes stop_codon:yes gene_type:complete